MIDLAYAMGAGGGGAQGGDMSFLIMIGVMFAIFYFLLIRPQQKKQKETREMQANLSHGDMVITSGGIHGKVAGITDAVVTLEVADKVKIKISRNFISAVLQKAGRE
ncbi:MAG: preprotein translocase subunit YajC [Syntrophales bacterium]